MEFYKNPRTDLALEAHEMLNEKNKNIDSSGKNINDGIEVRYAGDDDIKITRVRVISPEGEKAVGKPIGNYITLEIPGLRQSNEDLFEKSFNEFGNELTNILKLKNESTVLVVGLGNWNVTPDSLGPKVVSKLEVTRHLVQYAPEQIEKGTRPICAIAPGVLGITGIETFEIVKGVVDRVKPELVIAIDALASRKMERVSTTIQIADTGISPGSGVGNKRTGICKDTLGVDVIAIGVPTVVDAATMASDTIDLVIEDLTKNAPVGADFYNLLNRINKEEKYELIQEVLKPNIGDLIVTPKEIDDIIIRVSEVIANGINMALAKKVS